MKYQEDFTGAKADFGTFLNKAANALFSNKLIVEGKAVKLPADRDLNYKIKFDDGEEGGAVSIKVSWDNEVDEEEDELEEDVD